MIVVRPGGAATFHDGARVLLGRSSFWPDYSSGSSRIEALLMQ